MAYLDCHYLTAAPSQSACSADSSPKGQCHQLKQWTFFPIHVQFSIKQHQSCCLNTKFLFKWKWFPNFGLCRRLLLMKVIKLCMGCVQPCLHLSQGIVNTD